MKCFGHNIQESRVHAMTTVSTQNGTLEHGPLNVVLKALHFASVCITVSFLTTSIKYLS